MYRELAAYYFFRIFAVQNQFLMYTSYHLNSNELNADFLESVKKLFKNKRITISIEEEMDETEYLLSTDANRKHLEDALNSKEGYSFTAEEFTKYVADVKKGKTPDVKKLRKVKL